MALEVEMTPADPGLAVRREREPSRVKARAGRAYLRVKVGACAVAFSADGKRAVLASGRCSTACGKYGALARCPSQHAASHRGVVASEARSVLRLRDGPVGCGARGVSNGSARGPGP